MIDHKDAKADTQRGDVTPPGKSNPDKDASHSPPSPKEKTVEPEKSNKG